MNINKQNNFRDGWVKNVFEKFEGINKSKFIDKYYVMNINKQITFADWLVKTCLKNMSK